MEYIYGALVLHSAGQSINEENLKSVLSAAKVNVDESRVKALVASLEGVNIQEAMSTATSFAAPAQAAAPAAAPEAPKSEAKEEKKEEVSEEEAASGLAALFG